MGTYLETLLPDVEVRTHSGRFTVQLEIPRSSTLDEQDITHILKVSSWDKHRIPCVHPGGRGAHIQRAKPIKKQGVTLSALQINGIGYKPFIVNDVGIGKIDERAPFMPPSAKNFLDNAPDGFMETSISQENGCATLEPTYRPTGTYTATELEETVTNTMTVAQAQLQRMIVPNIEAYGRYLDDDLKATDGQFGFLVVPIPHAEERRLGSKVFAHVSSAVPLLPKLEMLANNLQIFFSRYAPALRELHDAGIVHYQAHLSNMYDTRTPYLMDWTTMRRLNGNLVENARARALDLFRPIFDVKHLIENAGRPEDEALAFADLATDSLLSEYACVIGFNPTRKTLHDAHATYGEVTNTSIIAAWLLERGIVSQIPSPHLRHSQS